MNKKIFDLFSRSFGYSPTITAFAPGRVNLIGEHTDYNGGHVFPCAIDLGITGAAAIRSDRTIRLISENFPETGIIEASLDEMIPSHRWSDYPIGVIKSFSETIEEVTCGFDFAFSGNLPDGAGLSSSAALEVLTGFLVRELLENENVSNEQLALIGQHSENQFIGVKCGIMDQFASAMGKEDHAILLNSDTLKFEYAPIPCSDAAIVIINSGVKHSLASSAYNQRRDECQQALTALQKELDVMSLCGLSMKQLNEHLHLIDNEIVRRRVLHAVSENERTLAAAKALEKGDIVEFGRLMLESHYSLRDDYEVSCKELDFLVDTARKHTGVYGSRMTGGGFGGCTVNLIRPYAAESFISAINSAYKKEYGIEAKAYIVRAGSGVCRIDECEV